MVELPNYVDDRTFWGKPPAHCSLVPDASWNDTVLNIFVSHNTAMTKYNTAVLSCSPVSPEVSLCFT
jgi:hypothetical protein